MFSERIALKMRLEELDKREQRVVKEIQEEREGIYERLRRLDEQDRYLQPISHTNSQQEGTKVDSTLSVVSPSQNLTEQELKKSVDSVVEMMDTVKKDVVKIASDSVVDFLNTEFEPKLKKAEEWIQIEREQNANLKNQLEKNTEMMNKADLIMEQADKMLTKQQEEKAELEKQLEESRSIIQQFEKLFGNNGEVAKAQAGMKRDRNQRKGRRNQETKVKSTSSTQEKIDYTPLYDTAVKILLQHTASIPSHELKREVETKTGTKIQNMTTFMQRLMKKEPSIEKPFRGEYIYRREGMEQAPTDQAIAEQEVAVTNSQENELSEMNQVLETHEVE